MSTTPPEQPSTPSGGGPNVNFNLNALPVTPGNAELVVYILALIIVAIIALAADSVNSPDWVDFFKWVTVAYILSRGIAKASRVLEQ